MKVVYKVTYPNGKVYVSSDLTSTLTYFGSVYSRAVERDFTPEQRRDFTVRKQTLWSPRRPPTRRCARSRWR